MGISDKFDEFKGKAEELKGEMKGKAGAQGHGKGKRAESQGASGGGKGNPARGSSGSHPAEKAADFVNEKTGNKYQSQVDKVANKAKDATSRNR